MKLYILTVERCGYDEFDSVVVRAKDSRAAKKLVKVTYFKAHQGKIKARQVKVEGKPGVVLASFNAG